MLLYIHELTMICRSEKIPTPYDTYILLDPYVSVVRSFSFSAREVC